MKHLKRAVLPLIASLALPGVATDARASELTVPNSFTAGTRASAAQVNQNFQATATAVNDNNTRINDARSRLTTVEGQVASQGGRITALEQSVSALASQPEVPRIVDNAGQIVGALVPWQSSFAESFPAASPDLRLAALYRVGQQRVKVLFGRNTAGDGLQIVNIYGSYLAFTQPNCTGDAFYPAGTEQRRYEYEGYDEAVVVHPLRDSAVMARVNWTPLPNAVLVQSSVSNDGTCTDVGSVPLSGMFPVTVEPFLFARPFMVR